VFLNLGTKPQKKKKRAGEGFFAISPRPVRVRVFQTGSGTGPSRMGYCTCPSRGKPIATFLGSNLLYLLFIYGETCSIFLWGWLALVSSAESGGPRHPTFKRKNLHRMRGRRGRRDRRLGFWSCVIATWRDVNETIGPMLSLSLSLSLSLCINNVGRLICRELVTRF
jgi:hypothetical protein